MRQSLLFMLMVCGLALAGCGTDAANNTGSAGPSQSAQETAAPAPTSPASASPEPAQQATAAPAASPATDEPPAASGTKQEYLDKLNAVEAGLSDLQDLRAGSTASMIEAAGEEYARWDEALNQIYAELKRRLPESEMAELKEKQLDWITYRDHTAEEAALKFEGGTMQPLEHASVLAGVTKDRCYELVEMYME
ncbi:lysozyme inhibitor LprI family protein [Paenibacillus tengchongensis]|uniref:lysozyme inhibitor LprI family protein n=1 Tax=Paenibacillus tengchongensis TaxID=2608684 RepID=UPI001652B2DE|nr:lysozyme inhibitor LprI family protein [Paenibacillus tengchongensis]